MLEFEELFSIAAGCPCCWLIRCSAARSFAAKHDTAWMYDRVLGLGARTLWRRSAMAIPGRRLSQFAVMTRRRAHAAGTGFCSIALALCSFLHGLLKPSQGGAGWHWSLPPFTDCRHPRAASHVRVSRSTSMPRRSHCVGCCLESCKVSCLPPLHRSFLLLAGVAANIAFLGRLPETGRYSDSARHEGVLPLVGIIAFRPEARCSTSMPRRFWRTV